MTPDEYIDVMGGLSVLELSELVKQFEDKFNIEASDTHTIILKDKKDTEWYRKFEKKKKSTRIK